jgi:hypothetical protein
MNVADAVKLFANGLAVDLKLNKHLHFPATPFRLDASEIIDI